jgi:AcrR family transcriptional regulator
MAKAQASEAKLSMAEATKSEAPPSSISRDARALRSGMALREGLLELLDNLPFDQITIRDICAKAGVHYATFFRHHVTKEALLDDIAKDQISQIIALTLAIRDADNYAAGFRAMCVYVDEHRALWSTLLNGGAGATMREEWLRQSRIVADAEAQLSSWLPKELGTNCAASLIAETVAWWVAQPVGKYGVDEVAAILNRLLATSIIAAD